jgi:beta-galactosidase
LQDDRGLTIDDITERFGYRWFSFDPDLGFSLNGRRMRLQGVNRHQDRYGYGNALSNELHRFDMAMIKSLGANFVRLAHYPQDPAVLEACDSLGLLVWEEIPVVTSVGKEAFAANARTMLIEMITQHFNHPSIIIWGLMNETMRSQPEDEIHWTVDLCRELHTMAKRLDPSRKTAQAQFGDRGTDILAITDIRGWNRYFGWYYGEFSEFGPFLDADRQKAPGQVIMVSEYGADNLRGYHSERPMPSDFTEEWALALHKSTWQQIVDRPYIAGSAVWNMFDFASDEKTGNDPRINQKGLATFDRKPKDAFYYYQSQWSDTPMVYIVSRTWRERYGVNGEQKDLEVFSNGDSVEVCLNGESLGTRLPPFVWPVRFTHGYHHIRAVAWKGGVCVEDVLRLKYTELGATELRHHDEKEQ